MIITKILTMEQAYRSMDWQMIFLMAGVLPLGLAMEKTGAATFIGTAVLVTFCRYGNGPAVIPFS